MELNAALNGPTTGKAGQKCHIYFILVTILGVKVVSTAFCLSLGDMQRVTAECLLHKDCL